MKNGSYHLKKQDKIFTAPNQNVSFHVWTSSQNNRLHKHEFFEFFLATEGKIKHVINGETEIVEKGTLCLIRPSDTHKLVSYQNKPTVQCDLKITPTFFKTLCDVLHPTLYERILATKKPISCRLKEHEYEHFAQTINYVHILPQNDTAQTELPLLRMLATNFLFYIDNAVKQQPLPYPQWFSDFLSAINTTEAFSKPLSELYSLSTYSQTRLNAYFNQYMNQTLVSYMTQQKINYACNLLRTTDHTVIRIATMASFGALGYFNTIFKRIIGTSPTQYRKQFRPHNLDE